jgi:hypothetical protein
MDFVANEYTPQPEGYYPARITGEPERKISKRGKEFLLWPAVGRNPDGSDFTFNIPTGFSTTVKSRLREVFIACKGYAPAIGEPFTSSDFFDKDLMVRIVNAPDENGVVRDSVDAVLPPMGQASPPHNGASNGQAASSQPPPRSYDAVMGTASGSDTKVPW